VVCIMKKAMLYPLAIFCLLSFAVASFFILQIFANYAPSVTYISQWSGLTISNSTPVFASPAESGEAVAYLARSRPVRVTAQAGDFMRVRFDDTIGYVHATNLRPAKPDIIPSTYWRTTAEHDTMTITTTPAARNDNITSRLIIHHTAGLPFTTHDTNATLRRIRDTHYFHLTVQNWSDLGYHFVIDGAGRIWEAAPLFARGTHSGGYFNHDIGISIIGNFHPTTSYNLVQTMPHGQEMTDEQQIALMDLCRWLVFELGLDNIVYGDESQPRPWLHAPIGMHSDVVIRACPGDNVVPWVHRVLRSEINAWVRARG